MAEAHAEGIPETVRVFGTRLSTRAQQAFAQWRWRVKEKERHSQDELRRRLAEKGIPEWPFLWPIEQAFGGTDVRIGSYDLSFGIADILPYYDREELVDESSGAIFVPVGVWASFSAFLGADGGFCLEITRDEIEKVEPSFESFLEYRAMSTCLQRWPCSAQLSSHGTSRAIAEDRLLPMVAEVSNEFHHFWQDDSWTLLEPPEEGLPTVWATSLRGLVELIDISARLCSGTAVRPQPSYDDERVEVLPRAQIAARAPTPESLRARPGARRFDLMGESSVYNGKPPSTGDVWISGIGDDLCIDVLERREGELVNYWQLTPEGSHAVLSSRYGRT